MMGRVFRNLAAICWMATTLVALCAIQASGSLAQNASQPNLVDSGRSQFNIRCAGCHGQNGLGGERAPAIGKGSQSGLGNETTLRNLIEHGIANTGMPAFNLAPPDLRALIAFVRSRVLPLKQTAVVGDFGRGKRLFFAKGGCADCHMMWGRGSIDGPDLTEAAQNLTLADIETALLAPGAPQANGYQVARIQMTNGLSARGFIRNESSDSLQMQSFDGRLILLSKSKILRIMRDPEPAMPAWDGSAQGMDDLILFLKDATPQTLAGQKLPNAGLSPASAWQAIANPKAADWPSYHGQLSGNRFSKLDQITVSNVQRLAPKWILSVPGQNGQPLEVTPVVIDGVMYVTRVNSVFALDARSGRLIWKYVRPASKGLVGDAAGGINRGVAVLGDRIFVVTDNAHLLALHRVNGALLWDVTMADSHQHYGATSAPLVIGNRVITGVSGGDEGIRGELNAFDAATGVHLWRFRSIPDPGDPQAAGWGGRALEHGCGSTWLTGTYDRDSDTLIWPIGNPCPDFNGDERKGDNLFTDSVVALDPKTGHLKWYYQFTPHDLHDWDATETPLLVDMNFHGRPRKLLLQANRNGFFYVLDRTNGRFLAASPFVKKLTWAKSIGPDGRPVLGEGWLPTKEGTRICPSMEGASNWMSSAYDPQTHLFYVMALEKCNVFSKNSQWWKQGESFYGGTARPVPDEIPRKYLRAIDPETGKIAWEEEQIGPANTWGGILATAGGLVFFCDDDGSYGAVDAKTGRPLWHFALSARWHASPMTYAIDGQQYVAIAANSNIVAFSLVGGQSH